MKRTRFLRPLFALALACSLLTVTAAAVQEQTELPAEELAQMELPAAVQASAPTEVSGAGQASAHVYETGNPSVTAEGYVQLAGAQETISWNGTATDNASDNNYNKWSSPVRSYLVENEDGTLSRVEYASGTGVLVETYDRDGSQTGTRTIEAELSRFGGFFPGSQYYFLVFGERNDQETDDQEVFRVVKYSKDWTRLDAASIKGANTYIPVDAGSLRMAEADGSLYLYTCHEMYRSSDGYHHQSNMTFVISQSDMTVTQSLYGVMNIRSGYVSHSFNQFVRTGGGYVYRVDHGDAYPRAVSITRCGVDGSITNVRYTTPLTIQGATGANSTGVSVGGFDLSDENCLIAGNSVDQSSADTYSAAGQRNIFLTVTDRDLEDSRIVWLTDYAEGDGIQPRTPHLAACGNDRFLVLWEEYRTDTQDIQTKLVMVDGGGNVLSSPAEMGIRLSDCAPVLLSDGTAAWYVTDGSGVTLYQIDPDNLSGTPRQETRYYGDLNHDGTITVAEITRIIVARSRDALTDELRAAADIDGNGTVTVREITRIIVARSRDERIARSD